MCACGWTVEHTPLGSCCWDGRRVRENWHRSMSVSAGGRRRRKYNPESLLRRVGALPRPARVLMASFMSVLCCWETLAMRQPRRLLLLDGSCAVERERAHPCESI